MPAHGDRTRFHSLAADGVVVAASDDTGAVFLSRDGGVSWAPADAGLPSGLRVLALARSGPYLFAATFFGGLWRRPWEELETMGLTRGKDRAGPGLRPIRTAAGFAFAFSLSRPGPARLEAFDPRGRRLAVWSAEALGAGPQVAAFGVGAILTGTVIIRLWADGNIRTLVCAFAD